MSNTDTTYTSPSGTTAIVADDGGAVSDNKNWYIAVVQTNCEKHVRKYLDELGIQSFLPVQTVVREIRGKRKEVERVVIRSRIFVRTAPDAKSRTAVKKVLFVKRFVSYPGTYQDAVVPDHQMKQFMYMLRYTDPVDVHADTLKIEVGQKVRVARGHLMGLEGYVCQVGNKKHTCLGIHMDILGLACVKIDISDLEFI